MLQKNQRIEDDIVHRSPSVVSDTSKAGSDALLNSEWAQVESIDLVNDGTGLGFGIVGVRTLGVVVKTILPGGVADRDGRLQSGDHILQVIALFFKFFLFLTFLWTVTIMMYRNMYAKAGTYFW